MTHKVSAALLGFAVPQQGGLRIPGTRDCWSHLGFRSKAFYCFSFLNSFLCLSSFFSFCLSCFITSCLRFFVSILRLSSITGVLLPNSTFSYLVLLPSVLSRFVLPLSLYSFFPLSFLLPLLCSSFSSEIFFHLHILLSFLTFFFPLLSFFFFPFHSLSSRFSTTKPDYAI